MLLSFLIFINYLISFVVIAFFLIANQIQRSRYLKLKSDLDYQSKKVLNIVEEFNYKADCVISHMSQTLDKISKWDTTAIADVVKEETKKALKIYTMN